MTPPPLPEKPVNEVRVVIRERLRLLSWGYYISGGIGAALVSFLLFHFAFFSIMASISQSTVRNAKNLHQPALQSLFSPGHFTQPAFNNPPPSATSTLDIAHSERSPLFSMGAIFKLAADVIGVIILIGWTLGALTIYAGRCIATRKHRTFVLIMAAINCLWIPYGTLLGIATFLTLPTPEAEEEYPA